MQTKNLILDKSLDFAVDLIKFCELLESRHKYVVSKQLLRSGTSVGANVFEAQHAESKADFIHKIKIAVKEASETRYWLLLCEKSDNYPSVAGLMDLINEMIRILSRIILSSKNSS